MAPNRKIVKATNDVIITPPPIGGSGVVQQVLRRTGSNPTDFTWQFDGSTPIFATAAARDAAWTSPPNGARCTTIDTYTEWLRKAGTWVPLPGTGLNPRAWGLLTGGTAIPTGANVVTPIDAPSQAVGITKSGNRLTIPYDGTYLVSVGLTCGTTIGGTYVILAVQLWRGASSAGFQDVVAGCASQTYTLASITTHLSCLAGDAIEIQMASDAAGKNVHASNSRSTYSVLRVAV